MNPQIGMNTRASNNANDEKLLAANYYLLSRICNHMQIIFKLGEKHGHAERKKMPIYEASLVSFGSNFD